MSSKNVVSDAEWVEAVVAFMQLEAGPENLPGISIFKRDADGQVYHTYSVFGSALLEFAQYNFMFDLTPEGRHEGAPKMSFLKHKDTYQFHGGIYPVPPTK